MTLSAVRDSFESFRSVFWGVESDAVMCDSWLSGAPDTRISKGTGDYRNRRFGSESASCV